MSEGNPTTQSVRPTQTIRGKIGEQSAFYGASGITGLLLAKYGGLSGEEVAWAAPAVGAGLTVLRGIWRRLGAEYPQSKILRILIGVPPTMGLLLMLALATSPPATAQTTQWIPPTIVSGEFAYRLQIPASVFPASPAASYSVDRFTGATPAQVKCQAVTAAGIYTGTFTMAAPSLGGTIDIAFRSWAGANCAGMVSVASVRGIRIQWAEPAPPVLLDAVPPLAQAIQSLAPRAEFMRPSFDLEQTDRCAA